MVAVPIRTVEQKRRKCSASGERHEGYYLVGELDPNGVLPAIVIVDPPIPFEPPEGHPLGRVPLVIDLDLLLEGASYEAYIQGSSAARLRHQKLLEPEIVAFGMPIERRRSVGICRDHGLEALQNLTPSNVSVAGSWVRTAVHMAGDKAMGEMVTEFSRGNWAGMLAALHRGWRVYPPAKRDKMRFAIAGLMRSIGAGADVELLT